MTIRVTDSAGATAETSFTITVTEGNTAPVLSPISNQSVNESTLLTLTVTATDQDLPAQTLTYSLVSSPAGATIGATTGLFSWTPAESAGPGTYPVTVRVADSGGANHERNFTVTVAEINATPVLASITNRTVTAGTALTLTASATDADVPANTLTYSLATAPTGATIQPTTGAFSWTPTTGQTGVHTVTVRVTDNGVPAASATTSFTVTVNGGNLPDLTLTALTTTATAVRPGTTFSASSSARNSGTAAAGSSAVTFRLSGDAIYGGADDVVLTPNRTISSLAINGTSTASTTLTVPASTPVGAYYVCASADGNSTVNESNESNNTRCTAQTIQVDLPDLTMTAVAPVPATLRRGLRLNVQNTVANIGPVASTSSVVVFRLSVNRVIGDADDILLSGTRSVSALAAGGTNANVATPQVVSSTAPGAYFVCATADGNAAVTERDETNNGLCSTVTVQITQ